MRVVGQVNDAAVVNGNANDGARHGGRGFVRIEQHRGLSVHVAEDGDERRRQLCVTSEVWGLAKRSFELVGDA
jgi:hypothetical protein